MSDENIETVPVMVRMTRAELDDLRAETGATADATAVACYVRKRRAAEKAADKKVGDAAARD